MRRVLLIRVVLLLVGVVVWGYGYRLDQPNVRIAAMGLLALALLARFVPGRWLGDDAPP